jgi:hypothetical protein
MRNEDRKAKILDNQKASQVSLMAHFSVACEADGDIRTSCRWGMTLVEPSLSRYF